MRAQTEVTMLRTWLTSKNARSARRQCGCRSVRSRTTCRGQDRPPREPCANGSVPNATTGKRPKARSEELAGAERQQHFLAHRVIELFELERGLALVAEHLDDRRAAFIIYFNAGVVQMNDVHLQGLHQKVPVVPAA